MPPDDDAAATDRRVDLPEPTPTIAYQIWASTQRLRDFVFLLFVLLFLCLISRSDLKSAVHCWTEAETGTETESLWAT